MSLTGSEILALSQLIKSAISAESGLQVGEFIGSIIMGIQKSTGTNIDQAVSIYAATVTKLGKVGEKK